MARVWRVWCAETLASSGLQVDGEGVFFAAAICGASRLWKPGRRCFFTPHLRRMVILVSAMNCRFVSTLPADDAAPPILISGTGYKELTRIEYFLICEENSTEAYEIRYETDGPFKDAICVDGLLAVGHGEMFYLFDRTEKQNITALKMDGYFGHLYFNNDLFYVADASGLRCINRLGECLWHNAGLAVDGVIVTDITVDKIFGQAEVDPPGGWVDFVVDRKSGALNSTTF